MTHAEIDKFLRMLCGHTLGHYETLRATYDIAAALIANGVPGDFVECGVYAGGECAAMALAIMNAKPKFDHGAQARNYMRRVHLFDSFQGMPRCGPDDTEFLAAGNKPGEACVSLEGVQANMKMWGIPSELLVYHSGWFEDTVPKAIMTQVAGEMYESISQAFTPEFLAKEGFQARITAIDQIALLRLDGDLYTSTKVCLEHLYPRLVRGGACILDDYPLSGCRKAFHEVVGYPQPMYHWKSV